MVTKLQVENPKYFTPRAIYDGGKIAFSIVPIPNDVVRTAPQLESCCLTYVRHVHQVRSGHRPQSQEQKAALSSTICQDKYYHNKVSGPST